tara:strand:- start:11343 stop:12287 length:945 start_codon:yes stop_codon:yes gene_type:complete
MANYSSFKKINNEAIINGSIQGVDFANGAVNSGKIASSNIGASAIGDGVVTSDKLNSTLDLSTKNMTYRSVVDGDIASNAAIAGTKLAANAATDNLGYTPVATGGSTMTGRLGVPAGSAGAPAIRGSDPNSGVYFNSGQLTFTINGSTALNIDNNGRVTTPQKPAFSAVGTTGWFYAGSYGGTGDRELNSIMGWNLAHQYGGSNFNTGNGRFTAPIAGWYKFDTMWYFINDNNSTPSYVHTFFRKNGGVGTTVGGRTPYNMNMHGNNNNYDDGASYSSIQYLNSGQYVSLCIRWHSNNSRHHSGHQIFSGHLIG